MNTPLVTVSVITYNSASTILETLDSIYAQSYPAIELIISDDCSSDQTITTCRQWISLHKTRFTRCRVIESDKNTGITANCNRAIADIHGNYLKLLAGDDLLEPEAISEYVNYLTQNPQAMYVFGRVTVFGNNQLAIDWFNNTIFDYSFFSLTRDKQYNWLIENWFQPIPAAAVFINAKLARENQVLFYDERIPMLEDWPNWIVLSSKGIDFHFIDKPLARYRVNENSVCSGEKYREAFMKSIALLYRYYQFKPTIRLLGFSRALTIYIKNMATAYPTSLWGRIYRLFTRSFQDSQHECKK